MTADEFRPHADAFRTLVRFVGNGSVIAVLLAFVIYGIAFWIWSQGDNMTAIVVVILGYALFRLHRKLLIKLAVTRFREREGFQEATGLLQRDSMRLGETRLLTELNAYLSESDKPAPPPET